MQPNAPIGIIGLGLMDTGRLIDAGVPWIGFDMEPSRCEKLKAAGGMVATSVQVIR